MEYKVEKGIELKQRWANRGRPPRYPFRAMEVGDSFEFSDDEYDRVACAMVYYQARHKPIRFEISKKDRRVKRIQ